jgi:hypothetical protein
MVIVVGPMAVVGVVIVGPAVVVGSVVVGSDDSIDQSDRCPLR